MFIFANELHYIFQMTDLKKIADFTKKIGDSIQNDSKTDEKRMSYFHANPKKFQQNVNENNYKNIQKNKHVTIESQKYLFLDSDVQITSK